jgi:serine/threonine protein kinase
MELRGRGVYRLLRSIGKGGMGNVYLAEVTAQPGDGGEPLPGNVAIKLLPGTASDVATLPRAEIGVMRALRHPNVVQLHDWRFDEQLSFAVLDYHSGGSLLDRLRDEAPLPLSEAMKVLIHILRALVETHGRGILHLDIKPANVLIAEDGRYLLTDFGIAGAIFQDRASRIIGTPAFMSPEQARGEVDSLDARSDLFMLGATLWQALTGDFGLQQRLPTTVLKERKTEPFPKAAPRVEPEARALAEVIDELLEFDPHHRPGTAAEVLYRVERLARRAPDGSEETTLATECGIPLPPGMRGRIQSQVTDPVLQDLFRMEGTFFDLRLYQDGEVICAEHGHSYDFYILLHGEVQVLRGDEVLVVVSDEGMILGEISALVGSPRTATLRAAGQTVMAVFKGAEMEQTARRMPALAVRIMKTLASRFAEERAR